MVNINITEWDESEERTKDTFMEEVESFTIFKIANFIMIYWLPVLIPVGLVGNILSFLVMTKQNNRNMSTCINMAAISINDNIMMCMCLHYYLLSVVQIHRWYSFECKMSTFVALFALQNGTFQVLAMTLDKYIAIRWPHKAATYSTPRRAKIVTVSVSIGVCIYNIPYFFISIVTGNQCIGDAVGGVITKMYTWFTFIFNAVIPFTMLIHMNFVIVNTVRKSHVFFKANNEITGKGRHQGMDTRKKTMKSVEKHLVIMLLLVTILFLILLCPTYFRFIYLVLAKRDTPFEYAQSMLFSEITGKLYASNSGIIFFLYCISGKKFRNELKEILCCRCQRKDQLQSSST